AAARQPRVAERRAGRERRVAGAELPASVRIALEVELEARPAPGVGGPELPGQARAGRGAGHAIERGAHRLPQHVITVAHEVAEGVVRAPSAAHEGEGAGAAALALARHLDPQST